MSRTFIKILNQKGGRNEENGPFLTLHIEGLFLDEGREGNAPFDFFEN